MRTLAYGRIHGVVQHGRTTTRQSVKGLRRFVDPELQREWLEGNALRDAGERSESLEQRFRYLARFEKLLRRPQAGEVLELLRIYSKIDLFRSKQTGRYAVCIFQDDNPS